MKLKVKFSTVARIITLVVAIANECIALFGQAAFSFTDSMPYQIISLVFTAIAAFINCWYNQDITQAALICGEVFDAIKDGELTEEEIKKIVENARAENKK